MTMSYDVIIIGGGHNGLVAAATLAKAGLRVLLIESRQVLGGATATEEVFPGFWFDTGAADAALFRPEIVQALELSNHDLSFIEPEAVQFAPRRDGPPLTLWRDPERTTADLALHSAADASRLRAFLETLVRQTRLLRDLMFLLPPDPAGRMSGGELANWLRTGVKLRLQGRREMMELIRTLPLSAAGLLNEWFETDLLKGALGTSGIRGTMQGPLASGTALLLLYHAMDAGLDRMPGTRFVRGGTGRLPVALAELSRKRGADLRCGARVKRILVEDNKAIGVQLSNGEEIRAAIIASSADPRHTLLDLVGPEQLPVRVVRRVRNMRFQGSTARINLALSGLPQFAGQEELAQIKGRIVISPSLEYLERAYDDAKYGRFSSRPYLEAVIPSLLDPERAPPGKHIMSVQMQYAPFQLAGADWNDRREALGDAVVVALTEYAPNLADLILERQVITPLDWQREYGLPDGSIYHGQMALDQMFIMRPIPGFARYQSPVSNLYFCGAGAHPGGGVTGVPGYNAAQVILSKIS